MHTTRWMAGVSACVRAADLCHSSAAWQPHPLWAMCQKFIFASSVSSPHSTQTPECKQYTDNTEAHEPIVTGYTRASTWTPPTLNWKLLIWKTKLYFQSNGMSEQDSLGDKFACKSLRQKCGHQLINWKLWLMAVSSSSSTANYFKKAMHVRSLS